jgi:hypothetical protein
VGYGGTTEVGSGVGGWTGDGGWGCRRGIECRRRADDMAHRGLREILALVVGTKNIVVYDD